MSNTLYKNFDVRMFRLGLQASRAAAIAAATQNLFTVSGGNILVTSFVGEVTKLFDAAATTLKIHFIPTDGTATALDYCVASAAQNAAPVGRHYHLPTAVGSALQTDDAAKSGYAEQALPLLVPPGVISLVIATGQNAVTGGMAKWDMTYIPLDTGVKVTVN
jgi:hypothetical protein